MPTHYEVRPFDDVDVAAAASFMAARHRQGRALFPILPSRFEAEDPCAQQISSTMTFADGYAATTADGALAGFLFAFRNIPAPASGTARYAAERSSMMLAHAHAVAPGVAPYPVYNALFARVAENHQRFGIFDHMAHVPAGDPALDEAWNNLGFGRAHAVAARTTEPNVVRGRQFTVLQAQASDLELVERLVDEESRFHAEPPILRPYVSGDVKEMVRADLRKALADEQQAIFTGGAAASRPVGVISVGPPRGSPLFTPDDSAYIGDTAVLDGERGAGLGSALLEAALGWARDHGYRHATLHFATANAVSSAFWQGQGFVPVMYHLRRRLDERIAWAMPMAANSDKAVR